MRERERGRGSGFQELHVLEERTRRCDHLDALRDGAAVGVEELLFGRQHPHHHLQLRGTSLIKKHPPPLDPLRTVGIALL